MSKRQRNAFWRGVASAFNVWGNFHPFYHGCDPEKADRDALRSDWEAIRQDMEAAIQHCEREHAEELRR